MWNDYDFNSNDGYDSDDSGRDHRRNDYTPVTFYRPDGDTEGKDIQWCRDNGFFHIEEDLWSGNWYYDHFPDKRPTDCPVGGCQQQFHTSEKLDLHLRNNMGKAHDRYRKNNDIVFGPTPEEKAEKEAKEARMMDAIRNEKRADLIDTVINASYVGIPEYLVAKARQELRKMDEKEIERDEEEYEFPCTVQQCRRRFKTQDDLYDHLEDSKGKGHQKALVMFEKDSVLHVVPCLANGCQRLFMEEEDMDDHLMSEGHPRARNGHPNEAHARAFALANGLAILNDRPGSSDEDDETEEAKAYLPHEVDPSQKFITDYFS